MSLLACGTQSKLEKADRIFEEGGYHAASKTYRGIQSKVKPHQTEHVRFRLAESYRLTGKYREAQAIYESMFRRRTPVNTETYLRYAQALLANGQYDKAKEQLQLYKKYVPDSPLADSLMVAADWAKTSQKPELTYTVKPVNAFNTSFNEYAPAYASSDYEILYFTSSRKAGNKSTKTYDVTGEVTADIYLTAFTRKGSWGKITPASDVLNTKYEDGACAFNSSYDRIYFTRCMKVKREKQGCAIYTAKRIDDEWGEPEKLPLVADTLTVAHPSISDDGLTLYFVSDMEGSYGGMDIWKVTRDSEGGNWGEPINLGRDINTPGNEVYPFIHANGTLYFSSDGHPGLGGLDIFKAMPTAGTGWEIQNMGEPINSSADDFAIIFERENDRGFFSSNRKPSKGGDDIYEFSSYTKMVEYYFTALVRNAKTKANMPNADVRLIGNNGAVVRRTTGDNGTIEFRVNPGTDYLVISSTKGFLNQKTTFSSIDWPDDFHHRDTLWMTPTDKSIEIPNIFFEFGKATLTPDSRHSLDSLVMIMEDNPTIIIELHAHTDSRGSVEVNDVLSQQRAQAVVDYLINNRVDEGRVIAVGFGKSRPRVVDAEIAKHYSFLRANTRLDDKFINSLRNEEQQEICHQLNRRVEFQVVGDNYKPR
jgi:peptidoglycan-associated lipoprotein